ncbi:MAG: hypothetical protein OEW08_14545, partial [Gammaproteobacteria bacterium]|nr:hypothetical protein [Gammaproteobacteria bacterium]
YPIPEPPSIKEVLNEGDFEPWEISIAIEMVQQKHREMDENKKREFSVPASMALGKMYKEKLHEIRINSFSTVLINMTPVGKMLDATEALEAGVSMGQAATGVSLEGKKLNSTERELLLLKAGAKSFGAFGKGGPFMEYVGNDLIADQITEEIDTMLDRTKREKPSNRSTAPVNGMRNKRVKQCYEANSPEWIRENHPLFRLNYFDQTGYQTHQ